MVTQTAVTTVPDSVTSKVRLTFWERVSFETVRFILYALARTISLTGLYHLGRLFATVEWLTDFKRRRRINRQMERVLGKDVPRRRRRYAAWCHFVRVRNDKMMFLILDRLPPEKVLERFTIVNKHLLDEAQARGKGFYMAMSHMGSHHLVTSMLVAQGYRVAGIRDSKVGAVWRFIQDKYEQQQRPRLEYFYADSFPRNIYRRFADNFVVASTADVSYTRREHLRTAEVEIFGEQRVILTGPMRIAVRCGAPVVQTFVISRKNFRYVMEFQTTLIDPTEEQVSPELLASAARVFAAGVERFARRYPCHISRY